jgi:DNA-directed RNA polymerase subunit H (RpoH/RPB5)
MAAQTEAKVEITTHVLVPKHILLSEDEANQVLHQLNISILQLPVVTSTDPMAKAIGAKAGNVIKIERIGVTGKSIYYRRVV